MANAKRDQNDVPTLLGVSNSDGSTPVAIYADPTTHRLLVDTSGGSSSPSQTLFTQTQAVTIANSSSETSIVGTGVGSTTLSANYLTAGKTIRISGMGINTVGGTPPTITMKVKMGSTVLLQKDVGYDAGISNHFFSIGILITCYTAGVTGTVWAQGAYDMLETASHGPMSSTSASTINTTTTKLIDITFKADVADVDNSLTCTNFVIEALN